VAVGRKMIEPSKNETRWREITAQMLHAWNDGMASLRSVRSQPRFKVLTADIEATGLPELRIPRLRSQVMSRPEIDGCSRDVKRLLTDFDRLRERQWRHGISRGH
jgi:serine/threonine-protein kinase HipA